ncbi:hypothetical protein BGW37DRAFT_468081 [Umbelopsis sp. PMI_123]|nr:hypothetical protein BGW37DRAFT_468081 [Umbelopsis sp. PMI_123]
MVQDTPPSYGGVLASGIQDISAISALFGTVLCYVIWVTLFWSIWSVYVWVVGPDQSSSSSSGTTHWLKRAGMASSNKVLLLSSNGIPSAAKLAMDMDTIGLPQSYIDHYYKDLSMLKAWSCSIVGAVAVPLAMLSIAIGERIFLPLIIWKLVLVLAAFGVLAGYVGCFAYVQNFSNNSNVYVWLTLEIVMMLFRMAVWAWDPKFDEIQPITLNVEPDLRVSQPMILLLAAYSDTEVVPTVEIFDFLPPTAVTRAAVHAGLMLQEPLMFGLATIQIDGKTYLMIIYLTVIACLWSRSFVMIYADGELMKYGWYLVTDFDRVLYATDIEDWEKKMKLQSSLLNELLKHTTKYAYSGVIVQLYLTGDFILGDWNSKPSYYEKIFEPASEKCSCTACGRHRAGWLQTKLGSYITKIALNIDSISTETTSITGKQNETSSQTSNSPDHLPKTSLEEYDHTYDHIENISPNGNQSGVNGYASSVQDNSPVTS